MLRLLSSTMCWLSRLVIFSLFPAWTRHRTTAGTAIKENEELINPILTLQKEAEYAVDGFAKVTCFLTEINVFASQQGLCLFLYLRANVLLWSLKQLPKMRQTALKPSFSKSEDQILNYPHGLYCKPLLLFKIQIRAFHWTCTMFCEQPDCTFRIMHRLWLPFFSSLI